MCDPHRIQVYSETWGRGGVCVHSLKNGGEEVAEFRSHGCLVSIRSLMLDHPTTDESTIIGDSRSVDSTLDEWFNNKSLNIILDDRCMMTFPVSITPRRIVSLYNSSTFMFWGRLAKFLRFSIVPPLLVFEEASQSVFYKLMTQHYCLNSRWFNIRCLSNRQLSNSNRWLKENHDVRKTPRSFANMSTCLDTSYTPVLVLSIGFPSLKPSPQLARLFFSVYVMMSWLFML